MELDKRIKEGKKPLTCFDLKEAEKFEGKEGYFSDCPRDFADGEISIEQCATKGILKLDERSDKFPYINKTTCLDYPYFLPVEWVKPREPEKMYREYKDLDEFFDVTGLEIGDLIKLKFPGNNVAELLIVGSCDNSLFIGIHKYTFKQLFEMVEISISGEWQPFGVLEND